MESGPVFVAEHPWRGRALKAATAAAALLLSAWLVAIVVGALGFGSLPGVPLSGDVGGGGTSSKAQHGGRTNANSDQSTAAGSTTQTASGRSAGSGAGGGQSQHTKAGGGSGGSGTAAGIQVQSTATIPGSTKYSGQGRGAPTTKPTGGRGSLDVTPNGKVPGAYAGGTNPNAGGANAGGNRSSGGNLTY